MSSKQYYQTFNVLAIVIAIIGTVLCLLAFFTQSKPDSSRYGLTVDQAYRMSNHSFLMASAIWVAIIANGLVMDKLD
jgi:hypothetical protein